jgi:hypothetical protein
MKTKFIYTVAVIVLLTALNSFAAQVSSKNRLGGLVETQISETLTRTPENQDIQQKTEIPMTLEKTEDLVSDYVIPYYYSAGTPRNYRYNSSFTGIERENRAINSNIRGINESIRQMNQSIQRIRVPRGY